MQKAHVQTNCASSWKARRRVLELNAVDDDGRHEHDERVDGVTEAVEEEELGLKRRPAHLVDRVVLAPVSEV